MFTAEVVTLDQRARFIDVLGAPHGSGRCDLEVMSLQSQHPVGDVVRIRANRIIRRTSAAPVAQAGGSDLSALAAAFADRLHDAGMPVTPLLSRQYASALQEGQLPSRRSLYYLTRQMFVTEDVQLSTFNHVFADVFGAPAGADRYREQVTTLAAAAL
jgi:hypothetical protein